MAVELALANTLEATPISYLLLKIDYADPIGDTEKLSILVFEEGYGLTMLPIYCVDDIRYRTISNPYMSSIHDKVRELAFGRATT